MTILKNKYIIMYIKLFEEFLFFKNKGKEVKVPIKVDDEIVYFTIDKIEDVPDFDDGYNVVHIGVKKIYLSDDNNNKLVLRYPGVTVSWKEKCRVLNYDGNYSDISTTRKAERIFVKQVEKHEKKK
jgi:hypothetical protein